MIRKGTGGCACGGIRYEIEGEHKQLLVCHCTYCQTRSGSAFGMSLFLDGDALTITRGEPKIWRRTTDSGRAALTAFCPDCGTLIFGRPEWRPDMLALKPGTLDDRSWLQPDVQIWTRSKQPWVTIPDDAVCFEQQPAS